MIISWGKNLKEEISSEGRESQRWVITKCVKILLKREHVSWHFYKVNEPVIREESHREKGLRVQSGTGAESQGELLDYLTMEEDQNG